MQEVSTYPPTVITSHLSEFYLSKVMWRGRRLYEASGWVYKRIVCSTLLLVGMSTLIDGILHAIVPPLIGLRATEVRLNLLYIIDLMIDFALILHRYPVFSRWRSFFLKSDILLTTEPLSCLCNSVGNVLMQQLPSNGAKQLLGVWLLPDTRPGGLLFQGNSSHALLIYLNT